MIKRLITVSVVLAFTINVIAQLIKPIVVNVDQPKAEIQPTMWGIFFEDINFAADGGIYAELVKNRSFEFYQPLMGWEQHAQHPASGSLLIVNRSEVDEPNPRFARVTIDGKLGTYYLSNEGFRGMGIRKDMQYRFSVNACQGSRSHVQLRVELVDSTGKTLGSAVIAPDGDVWKNYVVSFRATDTHSKASLNLWFEGIGTIDIDMVSLFPENTWKNRPNGLRSDLVQLLTDLKPGFLRFPGGCIVEGRELNTRYQWKKTIGSIEDRQMTVNRWNTEFVHRLTPDYFQTFGLGFYEYFQLAEDIGAEPLPILNCGMACQFNTAEVVALDKLDPYVQDALDLIEFANGPTDSKWGKIRTEMGHSAPFQLKFLGIGNEQWGPQYFERYVIFEKAIKAKYPDIILVSGTGPSPDGDLFNFASEELKRLHAQLVDEHYYRKPGWFLDNADRYDGYDRNSYKIFAGEYAAHSELNANPENKNNWESALSEAAFMTGLERNADVVYMCSYAPLFAHAKGWQWTPDLIWFDNLQSYGTPNYYVQKLFSNNKGTHVLNMLQEGKPLTGQNGLFASAAWDKNAKEIILKVVNVTNKPRFQSIVLETAKKLSAEATLTILKSERLDEVNTFKDPEHIKPDVQKVTMKGKKAELSVAPYSFSVLKIRQK
jgi:alpha-N-arabinofuranosidase